MTDKLPIVLCFSGHDPSGGAGIQADIEALASHGCHACSIVTALTDQDTRNVRKVIPQSPANIVRQARTVAADLPIKAVKIGLVGSADIAVAIQSFLAANPTLPVVLDPVLAAGGGAAMADDALIEAIRASLIPVATILTPNSVEARTLALGSPADLDACGTSLLNLGSTYVLITGTHEKGPQVTNTLYQGGKRPERFSWDRLPHSYHGSGCTLAATIAALLAKECDPENAVRAAQQYTWKSLEAGFHSGHGQHLPDRFFWTR